jgi:hypothetical protein
MLKLGDANMKNRGGGSLLILTCMLVVGVCLVVWLIGNVEFLKLECENT